MTTSLDAPATARRRTTTALPGPRSTQLMARKRAAVAAGVGTTVPVFAASAGDGLVEDVDGNVLIDLGVGPYAATILTNDLTHDYVHENSAYSS